MDMRAYERHLQAMIAGIDKSRAQRLAFAARLREPPRARAGDGGSATRGPLPGKPAAARRAT